jgi:hypothetical protein
MSPDCDLFHRSAFTETEGEPFEVPADIADERTLRTRRPSKIEKLLQVPEFAELAECLADQTERAGFEPAERLPVHTLSKRARSATLAPLHEPRCQPATRRGPAAGSAWNIAHPGVSRTRTPKRPGRRHGPPQKDPCRKPRPPRARRQRKLMMSSPVPNKLSLPGLHRRNVSRRIGVTVAPAEPLSANVVSNACLFITQ